MLSMTLHAPYRKELVPGLIIYRNERDYYNMKGRINVKKTLAILLVATLVMGLVGIVSAERTEPYWNISGSWLLDFAGVTGNREFVALEQDEYGNVQGDCYWLSGDTWLYGGSLVGYVSGNSLYLFYDRSPEYSYTGEFFGTINQYGMSGNFTDIKGNNFLWSTTGSPVSLLKDAPAVAVELLKHAQIPHRYGSGKTGGNLVADVAHAMGPGSDFNGVSKYDKCAYRYEIAMFLNKRMAEVGVVGEVKVPTLLYTLQISSINHFTGNQHDFTIYYDVNTGVGYGTGTTLGGTMGEVVSNVTLEGNVLSFTELYDNGYYTWSFTLESDGILTFIDRTGDNFFDATGTWSLSYVCE